MLHVTNMLTVEGWGWDTHQDKVKIVEFKPGAQFISSDKSYRHHDTEIQATALIVNKKWHSCVRHLLASAVYS